jgi:hypothetical protein
MEKFINQPNKQPRNFISMWNPPQTKLPTIKKIQSSFASKRTINKWEEYPYVSTKNPKNGAKQSST